VIKKKKVNKTKKAIRTKHKTNEESVSFSYIWFVGGDEDTLPRCSAIPLRAKRKQYIKK
jgi:hypothetical protein